MGRRCLPILIAVIAALVPISAARADGDPGSDVLVYQSLFLAADSGISVKGQVQLGDLIAAADRAGLPIRVAIIARPDDLGTVTPLWEKPQTYARYLGIELSLAYSGRLLVVMPDGFGFNWPKHDPSAAYAALAHVPHGAGPKLATSAAAAIRALAAAAHVQLRAGSGATDNPDRNKPADHHPAGCRRPVPGRRAEAHARSRSWCSWWLCWPPLRFRSCAASDARRPLRRCGESAPCSSRGGSPWSRSWRS